MYALTALRLPEPVTPLIGPDPAARRCCCWAGWGSGCCSRCRPGCWPGCGAHRAAARAEARLRAAVAEVANELVVTPIQAELAAYESLRAALARLRPSG